ncbi:DNA sulfur modification protein DndD [Butyrivibrio sp. Su6]|uniref:DNA sulfur modification protein DndD n=1 Tax=Butyrivibrio sp. Su6 TaxID=1520810 RepID=UPI00089E143B|nr:DNA sulfur modification protein DndD [Butyrivibrio sp. Su6]SEF62312.1 DNA sulfur modification protein DndD [Butyrivibrio sp. Su6]
MIIKKLTMHNFGVYADTNVMEFTGNKPVVLIGGMNGRGKTTILEAVLLSLYGSNSFAYTESKYQTYGQYLKSYVNKKDGTLESFVEIVFSMDSSDEEVYQVHREWDAKGQRVHERIWVRKNGEDSAFLTENWPMFVESILPSALSNFFFFDGEKIAELAVEDTSYQMKESIKAMLGISVLDILDSDISKIITRIGKKISSNQDLGKLEELRNEKDAASEELKMLDEEISNLEKQKNKLVNELESLNSEYQVKGGDIVEQKHDLMQERANKISALASNQEDRYEIASGELPLVLVMPLLKDIRSEGEVEHERMLSSLAIDKIKDAYAKYDKKNATTDKFITFMQNMVGDDQSDNIYNLSDATLYKVGMLCDIGLVTAKEQVKKLLKEECKNQKKIDEIDGYLSVDINEKELSDLFKTIKATEKELANCEIEIEDYHKKRSSLSNNLMMLTSEFSRMAENVLSALEAVDSDERVVKYAHMAQDIIEQYKIRLQARKTSVLAETMTACYKKLANKKNLVSHIEMNPETLDLLYLNKEGEVVTKERLSAGEKQLMVISLLWALAICSKKKLPVIIDTPLSRLDSAHRESLITTYFPNASEQTIILSTDSEIDERYYELMQPSVGDRFTLEYDDEEKTTSLTKTYFGWE